MGACASCLGRGRQDAYDEEDESRLLLDDPNNFQYGSFGEQNANTHTDPLESQRELEALQKVVAKTSNNLVDIFEIAPSQPQQAHPPALNGQDARLNRYQTIISKLSTDDDISTVTAQGQVDWLSDDDTMEVHMDPPTVKAGESLVGTFADAVVVA